MELLLGVRLNPVDKMSIVKMNDIDVKNNVAQLRTKTSEQINSASDTFDFIYCGCLLEDEAILESYGLKNGSMIHVLKRKEKRHATSTFEFEINVEMLASMYKSVMSNPILEIVMRRLTKRLDDIENIISFTPGLSEDAVAVAILQDPDLMIHFTNVKSIKKIAELHPALLEAAHHIASSVHDEASKFSSSSSANPSSLLNAHNSSGHSYNLESDDEEMAADSSQSSDSTQPSSSTTPSRTNSAVNAQLLAAISRAARSAATEASNTTNSALVQPSLSQSNSNSGGVITFEMFYQAMQQAFASNPSVNNPGNSVPAVPQAPTPPVSSNTTPNSSAPLNLERQIAIMHEMGLPYDYINIQALQITNGDVQAAIELVLSGFGDN
ncbi:ubiquitin-like protein 7 [Copidosoma floridanum]|uniref:ubiquitin-like protein 7 n=1 Tax=Copidosoma floridanum TaxID=29053 RepID=UPI0006C97680|nr:ubiquitin-like protein 7 [Copidosoma floridanum]XP_014207351.1 ubiquitin-like protein 7 [Copidosoma floridanum]XP_014207352.1 ubiquitin-like protein 7 [Copidosoma floridanum]